MRQFDPITELEMNALKHGATPEEFEAAFPACAKFQEVGGQQVFAELEQFFDWLVYDKGFSPRSRQASDRNGIQLVYEYLELDYERHRWEQNRMLELISMHPPQLTVTLTDKEQQS